MPLVPLRWDSGRLQMLDQRRLPVEEVWLELKTHEDVAEASREMGVRGAPAIGVAAAYGMAGLIAAGAGAKVAAKAGLLAVALAFLKKGAVVILIAGAAVLRFVKGLFGRKEPPGA